MTKVYSLCIGVERTARLSSNRSLKASGTTISENIVHYFQDISQRCRTCKHAWSYNCKVLYLQPYHRFPWFATLKNKTAAETFAKFPSVLRVIDRADRNPPITATSETFRPSLRHSVIGGFRSDLSIRCVIDGNFGNVSVGVLFSKVANQGKRW